MPNRGQLLWEGQLKGLHLLRDAVLMDPNDVIELALPLRRAYRGEIDIIAHVSLDKELTPSIVEEIRSLTFSVMSMVNLQLKEHLVPTLPFQISRVLNNNEKQLEQTVNFRDVNRAHVQEETIEPVLKQFVDIVTEETFGKRMMVALELYAAHFAEAQSQVRFLLLVIAMESLAEETQKHEAALSLLSKWQTDLDEQLVELVPDSEAYFSLQALRREMFHRRSDSIRSQIRNLFSDVGGTQEESQQLQKCALKIYDKRSALVHNGSLPDGDITSLEDEARKLVETLFWKIIRTSSAR